MTDPYQLAENLLALVVSGFSDAGVVLPNDELTSSPDYGVQYVAPGLMVAYDGPQVTTNITRLFHGQPGAEVPSFNPRMPAPLSCTVQVVILRSAAAQNEDGSPPSPEDLQADAQSNITDLVTLRQILYDVAAGKTDPLLVPPGTPITLDPVAPLGPIGGLVGVAGTLSVVIS